MFRPRRKPDLDLTTDFADPTSPVQWTFQNYWEPENGVIQDASIDLEKTPVKMGDKVAVLKSVFSGIDDDGQLMLDTDAYWSDGDNEAVFDFEFDTEGEQFGAGTAFAGLVSVRWLWDRFMGRLVARTALVPAVSPTGLADRRRLPCRQCGSAERMELFANRRA